MLTVKLMMSLPTALDPYNEYTRITCRDEFEVHEGSDGSRTIFLSSKASGTEKIEISNIKDGAYQQCYVENPSGKTVYKCCANDYSSENGPSVVK